jgi:hypothetical protein
MSGVKFSARAGSAIAQRTAAPIASARYVCGIESSSLASADLHADGGASSLALYRPAGHAQEFRGRMRLAAAHILD